MKKLIDAKKDPPREPKEETRELSLEEMAHIIGGSAVANVKWQIKK